MLAGEEPRFKKFSDAIDKLMFIIAGSVIATLLIEYGFYIDDIVRRIIHQFNSFAVFYFVFFNLSKLVISEKPLSYIRRKWIEFVLTFLILVQTFGFLIYIRQPYKVDVLTLTRIYIASVQVYLALDIWFKVIRYSQKLVQKSVHPARLFMLSFLILIFLGTLLLLLPKATYKGISLIDALFTATSAVCVTGLTVVDTGSYFTALGQFIIMLLIQVGGLGVMTFTTFFITILGGISLRERVLLSEIFNEKSLAKISSTITRILLLTFTIEFIGAIALFNFLPDSLFKNKSDKIFHSVFHSISAFCNAGFSTFSNNLIAIKYNAPAILTIAFLFIAGGLGFIVLTEYTEKPILRLLRSVKFFRERIQPQSVTLSLHSKLALSTTFILIIFGTFSFFVLEFNNTLKGESFFYKVIHSFFQAVTPRTAGFNTLDISQISVATSLLMIFLMWVGASPGSTGGGIKTTSFALIILKIISIINGRGKVEIFKKQVHEETVMRAFVSAIFSILILSVATFFLTLIETGKSLIDLLFEVVSAFGTVGLSRGVTSNLTNVGKLIIIMMMFIGRVGVLTVSFALFGRIERRNYEFQKENILVT